MQWIWCVKEEESFSILHFVKINLTEQLIACFFERILRIIIEDKYIFSKCCPLTCLADAWAQAIIKEAGIWRISSACLAHNNVNCGKKFSSTQNFYDRGPWRWEVDNLVHPHWFILLTCLWGPACMNFYCQAVNLKLKLIGRAFLLHRYPANLVTLLKRPWVLAGCDPTAPPTIQIKIGYCIGHN